MFIDDEVDSYMELALLERVTVGEHVVATAAEELLPPQLESNNERMQISGKDL